MFEARRDGVVDHELRLPAELVRVDVAPGPRTSAWRRSPKRVAPDAFSFATCDCTSRAVDSYGCAATTFDPRALDAALQPAEQVLAVVVVLEEHGDLRGALRRARGTCRRPSPPPGSSAGSRSCTGTWRAVASRTSSRPTPRRAGAPSARSGSRGTARFCSVPSVLKTAKTLSCSTSCRVSLHRLRGVVRVVEDLVRRSCGR